MRRKRNDIGTRSGSCACPRAWLLSFCLLAMLGLDLGAAHAQTSPPQRTPVVTSGSGQYYFEFRSRQAWDYGHTFVVFGRVGEPPSKNNVAGLSPKGDDPQMWLMGHYVPVPSDTGWTDGDLEDRYITSRYRVLVSKEQYDRTVAFIRQLQAKSTCPRWYSTRTVLRSPDFRTISSSHRLNSCSLLSASSDGMHFTRFTRSSRHWSCRYGSS